MKTKKKVIKLTEKDLNRIVKRTIKEQFDMENDKSENMRLKPITLESIIEELYEQFEYQQNQDLRDIIETIPLKNVDRVIEDLAKHILDSLNYMIFDAVEEYQNELIDIIDKYE